MLGWNGPGQKKNLFWQIDLFPLSAGALWPVQRADFCLFNIMPPLGLRGLVSLSLGDVLHRILVTHKRTFIYFWHFSLFQSFTMSFPSFVFLSLAVYFLFLFSFHLSKCHPEMTQPLEGPILCHCFPVCHFTIDVCFEYVLAVSVKADKHSVVATLRWGDSCLLYRMYFCGLFAL